MHFGSEDCFLQAPFGRFTIYAGRQDWPIPEFFQAPKFGLLDQVSTQLPDKIQDRMAKFA